MKTHTVILALVLFIVLLFAAVNWNLFSQLSTINFLFYRVEAPLGFIMLGIIALITLLYMLFIGRLEVASLIRERKKLTSAEEARERAISSEKSRIGELEVALSKKIEALASEFSSLLKSNSGLGERLGSLENKTSALIGRFDEEGVYIVRNEPEKSPCENSED